MHIINYSTESETAALLKEDVEKSVEISKERYQMDVLAVMTDNAANMTAMGKPLRGIWFLTCNNHIANLLVKNTADSTNDVMRTLVTVLKEFSDPGN